MFPEPRVVVAGGAVAVGLGGARDRLVRRRVNHLDTAADHNDH
jgi:hypothetical protein